MPLILALSCASAADRRDGRESIGLDSYVQTGDMRQVPGVKWNSSGMTFNPMTHTLFVITDSPARIAEFTPSGELKRIVTLRGFSDPEGITHMEDDTYAIVEEGLGTINVVTIRDDTETISVSDRERIEVERTGGNEGLEGVTYDPDAKCFYAVKEKHPRKIYRIERDGRISHPWDAEKQSLNLSDLSDICFHRTTGHLVLLSHESRAAAECTTAGREISRVSIKMSKPEGLAFDEQNTLYVCGEPDDLMTLAKDKR